MVCLINFCGFQGEEGFDGDIVEDGLDGIGEFAFDFRI
jgi:hypothetical protein